MRTLFRLMATLTLVFALCGILTLSAQAAYLDFQITPIHPLTASISYAGGNNPLVAQDLNVSAVIGVGLPGNLIIVGGDLDFTTGNLTGSNATQWFFGSNPDLLAITLRGAIPALGINDPSTILLSGSFASASVTDVFGDFNIAGGLFQDTKNPCLVEYFFGQNPPPSFDGFINVGFTAAGVPPGSFFTADREAVGSGDLQNYPVPLPPTALLLGSGLLGLLGFGLRRK